MVCAARRKIHEIAGFRRKVQQAMPEPFIGGSRVRLSKWVDRLIVVIVSVCRVYGDV